MRTLPGIGVSRGIEIGPVYQFQHVSLEFDTHKVAVPELEWERYQAAVQTTLTSLEHIYDKAVDEIGTDEAAIFRAHMNILQDPDVNDGVQERILNEGINAEAALQAVTDEYIELLSEIEDEYIRARVLDIRDVRTSLLRTLLGVAETKVEIREPSVILSRDLTPSDCLLIPKGLIKGFCTIDGGTTSHTAILARSLGVPALVGAPEEILSIPSGTNAIIDGYAGQIIVEPDEATLARYQEIRSAKQAALSAALDEAEKPAVTLDGRTVQVFANIGSDDEQDLETAIAMGAEGVGLLRTEFIYLDMDRMPDEELQFKKYSAVTKAFGAQRPVILRTLDIGGDKQLPYLELPYEMNPFLGVRGLRLCLRNIPLFKTQLRAALRASAYGCLQIMLPMVTKVAEVRKARALLEECRAELLEEGYEIPERVDLGIMIEIPAAALMAEHLAKEVDFFSIGTNDLSQYTLAVDRTNQNLADLANAFDPAVLTLVRSVSRAAHKYGKIVGICGELAGDPLAVPLLVGLGLDELSMNVPALPVAKQIIRRLRASEMEALAEEALTLETPAEVKKLVAERLPFISELG
ncbi:MAG TPA: phosphoenolpyruvate--protein phosphotransferase [Anaerolineaceae bacterium]|nr:phosphoenolpyruvate--protein phosphotransferase [Anaerolineaceae bacterium]